jgi:three-Cys-motif partner protein
LSHRSNEGPPHLKRVSRIKHQILLKYLPTWQRILGSAHQKLAYVDCYAGPGIYEYEGKDVSGSPIIALEAAKEHIRIRPQAELTLVFVEKDEKSKKNLEEVLESHKPYPSRLHVFPLQEDAKNFVPELLQVPQLTPTFFMVDPYGHPLTIPIINKILKHARTEALITFMYYRINMDMGNPKAKQRVDEMFGHKKWRDQAFLKQRGRRREVAFLEYFLAEISAKYKLPFKLRFDTEDRVPPSRTKYYLIHASNHPKAVLLMKEIMWPLGDQEGIFDYSGRDQSQLFSVVPKDQELEAFLLDRYAGKRISFGSLREETWRLPFIEKQYRRVIKQLKERGLAETAPITSKTPRGLRGQDLVDIKERVSE